MDTWPLELEYKVGTDQAESIWTIHFESLKNEKLSFHLLLASVHVFSIVWSHSAMQLLRPFWNGHQEQFSEASYDNVCFRPPGMNCFGRNFWNMTLRLRDAFNFQRPKNLQAIYRPLKGPFNSTYIISVPLSLSLSLSLYYLYHLSSL